MPTKSPPPTSRLGYCCPQSHHRYRTDKQYKAGDMYNIRCCRVFLFVCLLGCWINYNANWNHHDYHRFISMQVDGITNWLAEHPLILLRVCADYIHSICAIVVSSVVGESECNFINNEWFCSMFPIAQKGQKRGSEWEYLFTGGYHIENRRIFPAGIKIQFNEELQENLI